MPEQGLVATDLIGVLTPIGQNLNKVFASAENLKEPDTRLRNLSFDGSSSALRLEFEIDSLPRAASVTAILNAGYDSQPWQLESVTASGSGANGGVGMGTSPMSASPFVPTSQSLRGVWSVQLGKL